tara:strand:- start:4572 stop:5240 length:669 start_codon:yes stop_codon:yes gene_type:complete
MSEVYFPTGVFKNILDYCGEPLPKDGKMDRRELVKWFKTKAGIEYLKKDGEWQSENKEMCPYHLAKEGYKKINKKNCILVWFRNKDGTLNNRYEEIKKYEGKIKKNKILSYSIMNIKTPIKDVKDIFYSKFNFNDMKLTSLEEDDNLKIIAIRTFKTKFGDSYIILTDDMKMYMSNKKITNFINNKFKNFDGIYYRNNVLFRVDIGKEDEYNGHKYNEIEVY